MTEASAGQHLTGARRHGGRGTHAAGRKAAGMDSITRARQALEAADAELARLSEEMAPAGVIEAAEDDVHDAETAYYRAADGWGQ